MISYLDLHRQERDPKATNTDIICLYRSFLRNMFSYYVMIAARLLVLTAALADLLV